MKITIEGNSEEIRSLLKAVSPKNDNLFSECKAPWWWGSKRVDPTCGGSLKSPCDDNCFTYTAGLGSVSTTTTTATSRTRGLDETVKSSKAVDNKTDDNTEDLESQPSKFRAFRKLWEDFLKEGEESAADTKGPGDPDKENADLSNTVNPENPWSVNLDEYKELLKKAEGNSDGKSDKQVSIKRFPGGVSIEVIRTKSNESTDSDDLDSRDPEEARDEGPSAKFDRAFKAFLKLFDED